MSETKPVEAIDLTCEKCGVDYNKPINFKKWNIEHPNLFFEWSLKFCDKCRKEKEIQALKRLHKILNKLANINDIHK